MEEPDYASYSLDELRDVERHMDRHAYPERFARVLDEIERRLREPVPDAGSPRTKERPRETPKVRGSYMLGFRLTPLRITAIAFAFAVLGLVGFVVVPKFAGTFKAITPMLQAVGEAYPGESINIQVGTSTKAGTTISVTFTNSTWAKAEEAQRQETARNAARIAYGAYSGGSEISRVLVFLKTHRKVGMVETTGTEGHYTFSPAELIEPPEE